MNPPRHQGAIVFIFMALAVSLAVGSRFPLLAQGLLTPPGAPAPTMKTLDQVQPRTPVSAFGTTLTAPGSYYLTTNLLSGSSTGDGILVRANNVTIDLNGFSIISTNPAGTAS